MFTVHCKKDEKNTNLCSGSLFVSNFRTSMYILSTKHSPFYSFFLSCKSHACDSRHTHSHTNTHTLHTHRVYSHYVSQQRSISLCFWESALWDVNQWSSCSATGSMQLCRLKKGRGHTHTHSRAHRRYTDRLCKLTHWKMFYLNMFGKFTLTGFTVHHL